MTEKRPMMIIGMAMAAVTAVIVICIASSLSPDTNVWDPTTAPNQLRALSVLNGMSDKTTVSDKKADQIDQIKFRSQSLDSIVKVGSKSDIGAVSNAWYSRIQKNTTLSKENQRMAERMLG